jgi:hypothetical protein
MPLRSCVQIQISISFCSEILTCAGSFPFDAACLCHSASSHSIHLTVLRCYSYTAAAVAAAAADYDSLESPTVVAYRAAAADSAA